MVWIKWFLKSLLLPPGSFFLLVIIAMLLRLRRKWQGNALLVFSFLGLFFISTPRVAYLLTAPLEEKVVPLAKDVEAQAIVILGGGQRRNSPEFDSQDTVSASTLVRLAYAAFLYKKTPLPILVSGGTLMDDKESEAKLMASALQNIFSVPTKWMEDQSQNTLENATNSIEILKGAGIKRILLVTEAWHMRRALLAFSSSGFEVTPAPTNFQSPSRENNLLNWMPNVNSLSQSVRALHEWLGYIWYRITIP